MHTDYSRLMTDIKHIIDLDKLINNKYLQKAIDTRASASTQRVNPAVYLGIDPTSDNLHIGHLIQLNLLRKLEKFFKIIVVIGSATGAIGDPSGKNTERRVIPAATLRANTEKIKKYLQTIEWTKKWIILENHIWFEQISMVSFIRDYCKHVNIANLLNKATIQARRRKGISTAEFLYSIVQGIDFIQLNQKYNCVGQIGGSDQIGNIINGIDLVNAFRSTKNQKAEGLFGITTFLLTDKSGNKIGKSIKNSLSLETNNANVTNIFNFLYNTPDNLIPQYFQFFTPLSNDVITRMLNNDKHKLKSDKYMQRLLCESVLTQMGAKKDFQKHIFLVKTLFHTKYSDLTEQKWDKIKHFFNFAHDSSNEPAAGVHWMTIQISDYDRITVERLLASYKICDSLGEARRLIKGGGIAINNTEVKSGNLVIKEIPTKHNIIFVKIGKRRLYVVKILSD